MRYTLRNLDKEKETDRQYNYYKKLAIETERKAKERGREYQEFSTKIDEEIKEGHRKYRKGVKKLNLEAKKIIKEGVSEYSNKLVALGAIQKEEKKQGYIPLL
jgi:aromatic ring-opening dioxygenase catalytic subunit (LigB family)